MLKGSVHPYDIKKQTNKKKKTKNIYAPNNRASNTCVGKKKLGELKFKNSQLF